ncbi:MAG: GntR family transcriptional regulator [Chloroflexi bacterium]|nr:GntR family transcriptional regulator [Chloroflexota bacterium]
MSDEPALISRPVLADQVKDRLLQDILAGRYPANGRIIETRVARELGTSQAPVREALRGLEALGVVEILPFRGARVRHPDAAELLESYVVRSAVEALAARLAVPQLTEADLDDLAARVNEMQEAARGGDRHAVAAADAAFHEQIVRIAGNATLQRVWRSLEPFSRTYLTLVFPGADAHWTADLHPPIFDALQRRDANLVVAALDRHFKEISAKLEHDWAAGAADRRPAPPGAVSEAAVKPPPGSP